MKQNLHSKYFLLDNAAETIAKYLSNKLIILVKNRCSHMVNLVTIFLLLPNFMTIFANVVFI